MTGDEIFKKYWEALTTVADDVEQVSADAVALTLRLAIGDGVTVGRSIAGLEAVTLRQKLERKDEMLLDLQAALDRAGAEVDGLREQVMKMDADAAELLRQVRELEAWKTRHWEGNGQSTSSPTPASTDSGAPGVAATLPAVAPLPLIAALPARSTHGAGDTSSASSVFVNRSRGAVLLQAPWWTALDAESNDWRISLDAGRRKFREVPKTTRLAIVQAFLRSLATAQGAPSMADYEDHRPQWMPTGSSLTKTFGCGWNELLDLREVAEP